MRVEGQQLVLRGQTRVSQSALLPSTLLKVVRLCNRVAPHCIEFFLTSVVVLGCDGPHLLRLLLVGVTSRLIYLFVQLFEHQIILRVFVVHELFQAFWHLELLSFSTDGGGFLAPVSSPNLLTSCFVLKGGRWWARTDHLLQDEVRAGNLAQP